jgi:NADP-dependent 3-hydroxy acid dehydrogenase YdfG
MQQPVNVLQGRIAIVTGASSGIGAGTAEMLGKEGAIVVLVARRADRLAGLVQRINAAGGRASAIAADVAQEAEAKRVVAETLVRHGRVDILVNSAGIIRPGMVESGDPATWRESMDINLLSPMYTSQAAIQDMRKRGDGHIVVVSSTAGRKVGAGNPAYTASKHGVNAFSEAMRQECAPHGIRVTIVEPGATETEVGDSIPDLQQRELIKAHVRKAGVMHVDDVAGAIVFALRQPSNVNIRELWIAPTSAVV